LSGLPCEEDDAVTDETTLLVSLHSMAFIFFLPAEYVCVSEFVGEKASK
jgi:hypothetical protein